MQISFCFCKTCICLKILENIQISVNMIDRLDIIDEYSIKCDFTLNTVNLIDAALKISFSFFEKGHTGNVLWFYLFGQGVPNETKGTINLKLLADGQVVFLQNLQFSPLPTGWHRLKMSEMVLRYLYEKQFL